MASLLDLGLVRTAAVERVLTPISCHLCHLVLLCDGAEDPEHFGRLEGAARAVAGATENMAAAASRRMSETDDGVLQAEMSPLLEPVAVSGRHVLLAAQKLCIQPDLPEHREELISAAQNVFLGVVKVLTVNDDAAIRKVAAAADQVLACLSELGSCHDIKSLLGAFETFSDALLLLNALTAERAQALQDPGQSQELLDSLETLKKCISMLHTALCTTIQHPSSQPARAAKAYILERVQSAVCDIAATLKSEGQRESPGPCGFYAETRDGLLRTLAASPDPAALGGGFDGLLRDLVFHCMVVANSSRGELQQTLVLHSRNILQLWSDMKQPLDDPECSEQYQPRICALLASQIQMLDGALMTAVLHQVLDTFLAASSVFEELSSATRRALDADSSSDIDLSLIQPLVEDFISYTDRVAQVAHLVSAVAEDAKSLENVANSRVCLTRLRAQVAPLSLELEGNSARTLQRLFELCEKWEEATGQLQDAVTDVVDVRELAAIAVSEMARDHRGCDGAYREQSYALFDQHATKLLRRMRQVTRSVRRHVDRSEEPIYRNGLLVLLKQVQSRQSGVGRAVSDMLSGRRLNVEAYSAFSDSVSAAIQSFKVLREGLDGHQHPHLLSPLRAGARQPDVSRPSLKDEREGSEGRAARGSDPPALEVIERDFQSEHEEELSDEETIEAELTHKYDSDDLKTPAVWDEPEETHMPLEFDLLPLVYDVLTVTKGKDVTDLNRACTGVLELSNCYAQAAREALAVVDAADRKVLESFRAELVSLTPLLVQTAQETAMSSAVSAEGVYKHAAQFSDLVNGVRRVLLPAAGTWFHAAFAELRGGQTAAATRQLGDIMDSCADVVQLLTSSDVTPPAGGQETFSLLHNKLNKAQNNTRSLVEFSTSAPGQVDQLEGLCILWGLSVQVLFDSLDRILGTSTAMSPLSPQKRLSALTENSLRLQEAARLTGLNCKSAFRSKQLTRHQEELRTLTDSFLQAADDLGVTPGVAQLAASELFQRKLLIKLRELSGLLSKANKNYDTALRNLASAAYSAAEGPEESAREGAEREFDRAAHKLSEDVKSASGRAEGCLNYVRDPRARSNLRSINDHLSFQISDIIGRARLVVETRHVCDTLGLDVQIQCWSAKAHFVAEEIGKQDGVHQEVKENIRDALQGRTPGDAKDHLHAPPAREGGPQTTPAVASWPKTGGENLDAAEAITSTSAAVKYGTGNTDKDDGVSSGAYREATSLTYTSLFLKQESDTWDPQDNRIVQVTRKMADIICYMTQYLKKRGPLLNKEAFVTAAKDVISNCQSVTQFIRAIASHCLDKQCTVELSIIVEQILTITNQLSIISNVNAVTPGCKSSAEILVKNAQNLLQTVLRGVRAAETACIMGLKQPEPNSDGAEAAALCFQWRRNLEIHRAQQTSNPDTDELGLRKTSSGPAAPSLAPFVPDACKFPLSSLKTGSKKTF